MASKYSTPPVGQKFHRWTVLGYSHVKTQGAKGQQVKPVDFWLCRCECGVEKPVLARGVVEGASQSCGCYSVDKTREVFLRHGKTESRVYEIWCGIRRRINDPARPGYHNYGGRGIIICERWNVFENFLEDMGEPPTDRHSIDRYPDKNGNYEPGNCRWATPKEQANNRRGNVTIKKGDLCLTVSEWADHLGLRSSNWRQVKRLVEALP